MELKLRWSVRKQKKADRVFDIHYVLIPASARPFLEGYTLPFTSRTPPPITLSVAYGPEG